MFGENPRLLKAFEDLFEAVPGDFVTLQEELDAAEERIDALEPTRKTITVADSPYQILSGDVLKIDKSGGDISVLVPASGWFKFSIEGDSNTLTVDGPVNGETGIEFYFDGTGRQAEFIDDWRWI